MPPRPSAQRAAVAAASLTVAVLAAAAPAGAAAARPDLVVKSVSSPPATVQAAGPSWRATDSVRNAGSARAKASVTGWYLSRDSKKDSGDVRLGGRRKVKALAARKASSGRVALAVSSVVPAGTYVLIACADDTRKVREKNERNNCRAARSRVTVTPLSLGGPPAPGGVVPTPAVSIGDGSVAEGNAGTATISLPVTLSGPTSAPVTVPWSTADDSATAPGDYAAASGSLTFAPGETAKSVAVVAGGDTAYEGDESFNVDLGTPSGATVADGRGRATILEDDAVPVVSIADASVVEGNGGTTRVEFELTKSGAAGVPVSVDWATTAGTAAAGSDFTAASGTVTFDPAETTKKLAVDVVADDTYEPDETFDVDLSSPHAATIGTAKARGTITADDPLPVVSIGGYGIFEGGGGPRSISVPITLDRPSQAPVSVDWATADDSATAPDDYSSASGTVTFAPGDKDEAAQVTVVGDNAFADNEEFTATLSNPSGATTGNGTAHLLMFNDDPVPQTSVGDATVSEGPAASTTTLDFPVTVTGAREGNFNIGYTTINAGGTATNNVDFNGTGGSMAFAPADTAKTVQVTVNGDDVQEADETVQLLVNAGPFPVADGEAFGTIVNDDWDADLRLTEVAPNIASNRDLVELRANGTGSVDGFQLVRRNGSVTVLATLPAIPAAAGDLIVVHFQPAEGTSETTSKTECTSAPPSCYPGAWDVSVPTGAITLTSNTVLAVQQPDHVITDAVPFASASASGPTAFSTDVQGIQAAGHWLPTDCGGAPCTYVSTPTVKDVSVDWSDMAGSTTPAASTMSRLSGVDTNSRNDWASGASTLGAVNP